MNRLFLWTLAALWSVQTVAFAVDTPAVIPTSAPVASLSGSNSPATVTTAKAIEFSVFARKDCTHCIALEKYLSEAYKT